VCDLLECDSGEAKKKSDDVSQNGPFAHHARGAQSVDGIQLDVFAEIIAYTRGYTKMASNAPMIRLFSCNPNGMIHFS
jgi:hypothetical protein